MKAALAGVLVADFTHVMAGPYCTMALADMGAEVIKIESPEGDPTRGLMLPADDQESPFFLCLNRNKKSIVLDLRTQEGRAVALDIVARADILVENYATGVMERLGFDYESLAGRFPRLIYCSVSAYGREGEFAARAGYDPIVQAESGLMYLNGTEGGESHKTATPVVDLGSGMFATQAVLAALYARERSGRGQLIDVPLFDTAVSLSSFHAISYLTGGGDPVPLGNSSPVAGPVGLYETSDGSFFMTVAGERVWEKLCTALGNPASLQVPEFASNRLRVVNRRALDIVLAALFQPCRLADLMARLSEAGVPAAPLRTIAEAVGSAEMKASGVIVHAPHRSLGTAPNLAMPMRLADTPLTIRHSAPLLGEHTREVLADVLAYPPERIAALIDSGAVIAWREAGSPATA